MPTLSPSLSVHILRQDRVECGTFLVYFNLLYLHGRQSEGKSEVGVMPLTKFSTVFHTPHTRHIHTRLEPWATKNSTWFV